MLDKQVILEKEIDLIQSCITRMSNNSFLIKGWTITITTVILPLLYNKAEKSIIIPVGIIMIICFWYLDSYFLRLERLYRWKYDWVIKNRLYNEQCYYDLNPYNNKMWPIENDKLPNIICIMFSKTIFPIYLLLFVLFLIYTIKF